MGTPLRTQIEKQFPGLPFHEAIATFILGQWPHVSIHDPPTYVQSLARVMAGYPDEVVIAAADPATGVAQMDRIPTIKELTNWLRKENAHADAIKRYEAMPKTIPASHRIEGPRHVLGPNLFIADICPHYERMVQLHQETKGTRSRIETRVCAFDGLRHHGVWVPLSWVEEGKQGHKHMPGKEAIDGLKSPADIDTESFV